jgi:glutamate carboxypeptidase
MPIDQRKQALMTSNVVPFRPYLKVVEDSAREMRERLVSWCEINSGSGNLAGLAKMLAVLEEEFGRLPGVLDEVELSPVQQIDPSGKAVNQSFGRALRSVCRPQAPLQIFFSGHMDTVFGATHHFQRCETLDANTVRGPGVADMKGGLLTMLKALEVFEQTPWAQTIGWEVLIGSDEEIGSPGTAPLLEAAAERHHLGLDFEPSLPSGEIVRRRKGSGNFTAVARGRSSHVGRDFRSGRNAIAILAEFIGAVHALNGEFPGVVFNIGNVSGGGSVNVVADHAAAQFNIRVSETSDIAPVNARLAELVEAFNQRDGLRLEWSGNFHRPPKEVTPQIEALFNAFRACGRDLGLELEWKDTGGCSDGNNLAAAGLPNLDTLGVRGGSIHSDQEFVLLDSLVERAQLTALFLMKLAHGSITLPNMLNKKPKNRL